MLKDVNHRFNFFPRIWKSGVEILKDIFEIHKIIAKRKKCKL
jgi:hypothetical protein